MLYSSGWQESILISLAYCLARLELVSCAPPTLLPESLPARQASVNAGIPVESPAWGVNQLCGSGLRAVALGAQHIQLGDAATGGIMAGLEGRDEAGPAAAVGQHRHPDPLTVEPIPWVGQRKTLVEDGLIRHDDYQSAVEETPEPSPSDASQESSMGDSFVYSRAGVTVETGGVRSV